MAKGKNKLKYKYAFKKSAFSELKSILKFKDKRQFALLLGVDEVVINLQMSGKRQPTVDVLVKIKQCGVPEKQIFKLIEKQIN